MCKKQGGTLPYALLILLQSVLYGFGNPLSKIGFESITVLWCLGIRFSGAAALMLLLFGRRTVRKLRAAPLLQCTQPILTAACSYLLLGGEAVGDRTGGSGAYRGLRGAGKLAERPKTNRIRIRGRSFLNALLFSYKETFAVEIGGFLTIVMCDAG